MMGIHPFLSGFPRGPIHLRGCRSLKPRGRSLRDSDLKGHAPFRPRSMDGTRANNNCPYPIAADASSVDPPGQGSCYEKHRTLAQQLGHLTNSVL